MWIANPSCQPVVVERKSILGILEPLVNEELFQWKPEHHTKAEPKVTLHTWKGESSDIQEKQQFLNHFGLHHLSKDLKSQMEVMLWKYEAAFSKHEFDVGNSKIMNMK